MSSAGTSRLVKKSPSVCTDLPLDNADVRLKLSLLRELLSSCFGPTARLKHVHNNVGGHVVTTSASSVLLPALTSSQPLVGLIKASVLNHVSRFSDCGLSAAIFCLTLIERARLCGLRGSSVVRVNAHLLAVVTGYLGREDCACKVPLDFSSSRGLVTLAHSIVSSKPACVLTGPEVAHMSALAVRAFLLTVPRGSPGPVTLGRTVTVSMVGRPVVHSAVFPGLLLDTCDALSPSVVESRASRPLPLVLFSASLAGDLAELGDGVIEVGPGVDTDSQILDRLLELCKQVVRDGVKVFVCQKVIHPVLQQYLRCQEIVVVERVGISLMEPLAQLTGAKPVATTQTVIPFEAYGKVGNLGIKDFGSKTMLHLQPVGDSAICTMILCHRNETMLSELKVVCQKAEHVLRLTLKEPFSLLGGGCTETHLAAYIRHQSKNAVPETLSALGCSQAEYLLGAEAFCRSLEHVASSLGHDGENSFTDLTHAHHWILPGDVMKDGLEESCHSCGCGLVDSGADTKWNHLSTEYADFSPAPLLRDTSVQPRVLDSYTAKLRALQVAVETANLALDVKYIIQDVN